MTLITLQQAQRLIIIGSIILTVVAIGIIVWIVDAHAAVSKGVLLKPKIITPAEIEAFNAKREQNQELTEQLSEILQCGPAKAKEETMCSLIFIGNGYLQVNYWPIGIKDNYNIQYISLENASLIIATNTGMLPSAPTTTTAPITEPTEEEDREEEDTSSSGDGDNGDNNGRSEENREEEEEEEPGESEFEEENGGGEPEPLRGQ